MRKLVIFAVAMAVFGLPAAARAQGSTSLASAAVSIWPEYDRPTALVIAELMLPSNAALPAQITLRVPSSVEKVQAVAVGSAFDNVTDQGIDYTFSKGEPWSEIKINANGRAIRVEYYDAALKKTGNTRQYTYVWPGDYAVDDFSFELRAPLQSSNVTSQPPLNRDIVDQDGFQYWTAHPGKLDQDQQYTLAFKYDRSTDLPSTAFLVGPNSGGTVASASSQQNFIYEQLPYIIGLLGVALLIGGGVWFWRSGRANSSRGRVPRRRHTAGRESDTGDGEIYCHNCGKRASPSDRFCRACGTRLRQPDS